MNDTHGVEGKGWYGFDLDGTLAKYDKWEGIDHIGEPVKPMVDLIKRMHDEGKVVKILTARVAPRADAETRPNPYFCKLPEEFRLDVAHAFGEGARFWCQSRYHEVEWDAKMFIVDWCVNHLGFIPEITHEKDHLMLELYDDRVKQVVPNEGLLVEDLYRECGKMLKQVHTDNGWLLAKLAPKTNGFCNGLLLGCLLSVAVISGIKAYDKWFGPEKEPARVRLEAAHKVLCDLVNDWPEAAR